MATFLQTIKPRVISADKGEPKRISNAGGSRLFYDTEEGVSSEQNDGFLDPGQSLVLTGGMWVVSSDQTHVFIADDRKETIARLEDELREARA